MFALNDANIIPTTQIKNVGIIISFQHLVTNQCFFSFTIPILFSLPFLFPLLPLWLNSDYLMLNHCYNFLNSLTPHSISLMMYVHTSLLRVISLKYNFFMSHFLDSPRPLPHSYENIHFLLISFSGNIFLFFLYLCKFYSSLKAQLK